MVSKQKAVIASLGSAVAVTLIHGTAHYLGASVPVVGGVVFASVFLIGYWGMRS
jgi:pantothenate kinase type III